MGFNQDRASSWSEEIFPHRDFSQGGDRLRAEEAFPCHGFAGADPESLAGAGGEEEMPIIADAAVEKGAGPVSFDERDELLVPTGPLRGSTAEKLLQEDFDIVRIGGAHRLERGLPLVFEGEIIVLHGGC